MAIHASWVKTWEALCKYRVYRYNKSFSKQISLFIKRRHYKCEQGSSSAVAYRKIRIL